MTHGAEPRRTADASLVAREGRLVQAANENFLHPPGVHRPAGRRRTNLIASAAGRSGVAPAWPPPGKTGGFAPDRRSIAQTPRPLRSRAATARRDPIHR